MRIRKIIEKGRNALIVGSTLLTLANQAYAGGFGKVGGYIDNRGFSNVVFTGGASDLPFRTKIFGFADAETERGDRNSLRKPYSEVSLSRKAGNGLGVSVEYNRDFNLNTGVSRVGLIYEPRLSGFLGIKFHPVSTMDNGVQIGVYGSKSFNNGNEYVEGFADYNFKPKKFVGEVQFGKRIKDNLYGVVEGRYNGFRVDKKGAGFGLEWKL